MNNALIHSFPSLSVHFMCIFAKEQLSVLKGKNNWEITTQSLSCSAPPKAKYTFNTVLLISVSCSEKSRFLGCVKTSCKRWHARQGCVSFKSKSCLVLDENTQCFWIAGHSEFNWSSVMSRSTIPRQMT